MSRFNSTIKAALLCGAMSIAAPAVALAASGQEQGVVVVTATDHANLPLGIEGSVLAPAGKDQHPSFHEHMKRTGPTPGERAANAAVDRANAEQMAEGRANGAMPRTISSSAAEANLPGGIKGSLMAPIGDPHPSLHAALNSRKVGMALNARSSASHAPKRMAMNTNTKNTKGLSEREQTRRLNQASARGTLHIDM